MSNVQSPPGFLNAGEFLTTIGTPVIAEVSVYVDESDPGYENGEYQIMYTMFDTPNVALLEQLYQQKKYPIQVRLAHIHFGIHLKTRHQQLGINPYVKEYLDADALQKDIFTFINQHRCRGLLSGKYLTAYVLYNYAYYALPAEYWCYDKNWYHLLIDGCAEGNVPSIGEFSGSIFFKKEEVNRCLSIDPDKHSPAVFSYSSLINLDAYSTPWLQVLAAVYEEHGKDKLAEVKKNNIQLFIEEYIKQHKLDIASTDIPYLAKFMRLAEQKEGKKYHAKRKLQNH